MDKSINERSFWKCQFDLLVSYSSQLYLNMLKTFLLSKIKIGVFISAFLLIFIIVSWIAWQHEPYYSFDESNTLRIASHSPRVIAHLLSYEQNFPAYYVLLHGLLRVFDNDVHALIIIQLLLWCGSILLFFLITKFVNSDLHYRMLFTLLFSLCSSISYYAFYIRMYGLVVFLFLVVIWLSFRYMRYGCVRDIYLMFPVLLGITLLHPSGLFLTCAQLLFLLIVVPNTLIRLVCAACGIGVFGTGASFLIKSRPLHEIYIGGVRYASEIHVDYHEIVQYLFFSAGSQFAWLVFLAVSWSFYIFVTNRLWKNKTGVILAIYGCMFIILTFVVRELYQPRHYIYFVPVLLLIMLMSLSYTKYTKVFIIILIGVFAGSFIKFYISQTMVNDTYKHVCQQIAELNPGIVITTVPYINMLSYCDAQGNQIIYSISHMGLLNISSMSEEQVIQYQVTTGGEYITSSKKEIYRNFLLEHMSRYRNDLQKIHVSGEYKEIYYIPSISVYPQSIYAEELTLFTEYLYKGSPIPGVFIFTQKQQS